MQHLLNRHSSSRKAKRFIKSKTLASYVGVFLLVITFVALGYQPPKRIDPNVVSATNVSNVSDLDQPSIDQVVAASLAGSLAERANLPIAPNVAELSVSLAVKSELAQTSETTISKPQIVEPTAGSRDIKTYTAKAGDNVQAVAAQYGISATTIKWANNMTSDALEPGRALVIPPVDGVVYTVKEGDTVGALATKYQALEQRITTFNDLEVDALTKDKKIIIPAGILPANEQPGYVAPRAAAPRVGVVNRSLVQASAGNRYAPGNCTWYAYERRAQLGRPIGSFWGNGGSWYYSAQAAGYGTGSVPQAGAVLVELGSPGHVGVVESVSENGDVHITEMNNRAYGGYGIVNSRTISAGAAGAYRYIY